MYESFLHFLRLIVQIKSNFSLHSLQYAEACNELAGPSPHHCARTAQLLSKKCCSGGKPLATLCPIWPARDLNLRPPATETNPLPLDQLAGTTYCCESLFTVMNFAKSKHRATLTNERLKELIRGASATYRPNIQRLASQVQDWYGWT